jgi:hypothetical protein
MTGNHRPILGIYRWLWVLCSRLIGNSREMQDYRAYVMGPDGHLIRRYDFFSLDDEAAKNAAKTHAKHYVDRYDVELWQLDRHVAFFESGR